MIKDCAATKSKNIYTAVRLKREGRSRMLVDLPNTTIENARISAEENGTSKKVSIESAVIERFGE